MTPINFTGSFVKNVTISKLIADGKMKPENVALVKLDKADPRDTMTLAETACKWENVASGYASNIYCDSLKAKNYPDVNNEHYFALTTQKENFEKLEADKILGLSLFFEKNSPHNELAWLQANPSTNHEAGQRSYKNIGKALVNFMKGLFKKPIFVQADKKAIPFYQKLGFIQTEKLPEQMIYKQEL